MNENKLTRSINLASWGPEIKLNDGVYKKIWKNFSLDRNDKEWAAKYYTKESPYIIVLYHDNTDKYFKFKSEYFKPDLNKPGKLRESDHASIYKVFPKINNILKVAKEDFGYNKNYERHENFRKVYDDYKDNLKNILSNKVEKVINNKIKAYSPKETVKLSNISNVENGKIFPHTIKFEVIANNDFSRYNVILSHENDAPKYLTGKGNEKFTKEEVGRKLIEDLYQGNPTIPVRICNDILNSVNQVLKEYSKEILKNKSGSYLRQQSKLNDKYRNYENNFSKLQFEETNYFPY